jgi:metal-sulfur cluster biosynthetic enzyme
LEARVRESLNELVEEETTRKLRELNIVTEIKEPRAGELLVRFSPLSPYSPIAVDTGRMIRDAALRVEGVKSVTVECSGHILDELVNRLINKQTKNTK